MIEPQIITIESEAAMIELGRALACNLRPDSVLLFFGDLGVGKSFLIRSIIRAVLADENHDVPSPSFTLIQEYDAPNTKINHIDLYRLGGDDELYELGIPDIFGDSINLIEWPERLGGMLPASAVKIEIEDRGETRRRVTIYGAQGLNYEN